MESEDKTAERLRKIYEGLDELEKRKLEFEREQHTPTILLVDDNETDRFLAKHVLQNFDCMVCEANSTEDAERLLNEVQFDYVFLDVVFPQGSGIAALRDRLAMHEHTHFVLVSGMIDVNTARTGIDAGAKMLIEKPLEIEKLTRLLRRKTNADFEV